MWRTTVLIVGLGCLTLLAAACSNTVYPVTSGSHTQINLEEAAKGPRPRMIIQADDPAIASALTTFFLSAGMTLVERSQLDKVLTEQVIQQSLTADGEARLIQAGKIIGANRLVIAEHQSSGDSFYGYTLSVSVRGIEIESGKVRWSGRALYPKPINNPGAGVGYLAVSAVARALCPIEQGFQWSEASAFSSGGCKKPG